MDLPLRGAVLASVALLAATVPAAPASAATITGKVKGARGYTLNGTSSDGRVVSKRLGSSGAFKLRFKGSAARGATLHLILPNGRYYGPIVIAHRGRKAFTALSGRSAKLGLIRLRGSYAKPKDAVDKRAVSRSAVVSNRRGKPVGAGKLGLVKVGANARARAKAAANDNGQGMDPDVDGVASAYDADDDGDLVLDSADSGSSSNDGLFSTLFLGFSEALNANAGATSAQIDAAISGENRFNLIFFFDEGRLGGRSASGARVDCFALSYCRRGTGTAILGGVNESSPSLPRGSRWVTYDPDGSGYPNLETIDGFGGGGGGGRGRVFVAGVQPRATTSQISAGDTYNVVFDSGSAPITVPVTLASYFVTTPAITSYSSGGATTPVSYPIAPGTPGSSRGDPIQLDSQRLTMTFWRPQRRSIPGAESGSLTDMGHLHYGVTPGGLSRELSCSGQYSGLSPTLTAEPSPGIFPEQGAKLFPLVDSAADAAPDRARTLSFTVDLGACLRAGGITPEGATLDLTLTAAGEQRPGGQDRAAQLISVRLPG
jgi:hypothetical protein